MEDDVIKARDMEDSTAIVKGEACDPSPAESQTNDAPPVEVRTDCDVVKVEDSVSVNSKNESGVVVDEVDDCRNGNITVECKERAGEAEPGEVNEDSRSLGDLDSLPAGDESALGAAGSDSGVEGCGRALSSGGGSRSCASSVVSCGSGCGSESSSLAGAPPRPRRRVNVAVADPKRGSPVACAPRAPNLATRERARSREKPTPPEKPRPLTPKPRIRPTADLPNLIRESPALRAKPTKTSTARCRTPNSPVEDKRWPPNGARLPTVADASATRVAADKYGTLPRRRRADDADGSPRHEGAPLAARRPTVARSASSRCATKVRVRIYAEKTSQTVLLGTDIESALAGIVPNIESTRAEVSRCSRGVQASSRDAECARLAGAAEAARAAAAQERERRQLAEAQLAAERAARLAAIADLEDNTQRLLALAGDGAGAGADAAGCLRALEEQLRAARELAARQRADIDALRTRCDQLHTEACTVRESNRSLSGRLAEAEREAGEMHEFLAAETGALGDSLREAEAELARTRTDLERSRAECRQLVRMCEQRRQEALGAAARARWAGGEGAGGACRALDALAQRLHTLRAAVVAAYSLPEDAEPTVYYNDAYSRSDSGEALTPDEEGGGGGGGGGGGLVAALSRALRAAPPAACAPASGPAHPPPDEERSRVSDDNDNSADLLDSETEPCLVTDPEYAEEWWSGAEGAEGAGAWSGEELSPERESCDGDADGDERREADGDSLRTLSAAIAQRQRSEAEQVSRGPLLARVVSLDAALSRLLVALRDAAAAAARRPDHEALRLAHQLRDKIDVTEKNVADVVVKKLAELDASRHMMEQYRHSVENLKKQLAQSAEEEDLKYIEEELRCCDESERRARYAALDNALTALAGCPAAQRWPRLAALRQALERLAFALASPDPAPAPAPTPPLHSAATATA